MSRWDRYSEQDEGGEFIHPLDRRWDPNSTVQISEAEESRQELNEHLERMSTRTEDTLGPCGCVDYHYADCDLRTGGSGRNTKADWEGHDWDADEGGY